MKHKVGDRVAFIARQLVFGCGKVGTRKVGYIKQVRKSLFGTRYVICLANSYDIFFVRERDIFNKIERKEKNDEQTDTRI